MMVATSSCPALEATSAGVKPSYKHKQREVSSLTSQLQAVCVLREDTNYDQAQLTAAEDESAASHT